jgi:glucose-1-phosphate cytidylyltransferase
MEAKQSKNIPVVIFCGGKGTRMKEETEFKPKPMVTVGGMPILWHIMKLYSHHGYNKFILTLGYKGNYIKDYFLKHKLMTADFVMRNGEVVNAYSDKNHDFEIVFADTGEDTKTGERLLKVKKYIPEEQFMVTYGDGVTNLDINALVDFHNQQTGVVGTLTGVHPTSKYGLVNVDDDARIASFEQKPRLSDFVNGGFMVFNQSIFDYLKPGEMIEDAFIQLAEERKLAMYKHPDFWQCMDTYKDSEDLNKLWEQGAPWKLWQD